MKALRDLCRCCYYCHWRRTCLQTEKETRLHILPKQDFSFIYLPAASVQGKLRYSGGSQPFLHRDPFSSIPAQSRPLQNLSQPKCGWWVGDLHGSGYFTHILWDLNHNLWVWWCHPPIIGLQKMVTRRSADRNSLDGMGRAGSESHRNGLQQTWNRRVLM